MALTKASLIDINGQELILDADADTSITADTDDQIDIKVGGSDTVHMGLTTYNASDRLVATNTSGNASITIVGATDGESSIFMADGTSGDASYRGYVQYQHTNDNMNFGTAGAERMRIISTGQIGVGLTAPASNGGANAGLIHLHGGSADWSVLHCTTPSSGTAAADGLLLGMIVETVYVFSYQAADMLFGVGGQTKAKIDGSNGDFFTNDGSVSSLSDKRIKKNITPLAEGLDLVKKLNPVNFEYCNTYEGQREDGLGVDDDRIHKGFIADEVQEVAPSYVEETTGVVLNEEVDDLKTLSMTAMIPMLVKSIQELSAKVEELESKIDG